MTTGEYERLRDRQRGPNHGPALPHEGSARGEGRRGYKEASKDTGKRPVPELIAPGRF
jgi:hypothetical protein